MAQGQFLGFVALNAPLQTSIVTRNPTTNTPQDASTGPSYRVYGPAGLMAQGTGTLQSKDPSSQGAAITGATNATPIVITSAGHNLNTGTRVTISGVTGNTAANGDWGVTVLDANTFSLNFSAGNGAYAGGGAWHVTGLYALNITPLGANGYVQGQVYSVLVSYVAGSNAQAELYSFMVV